MRKIWNYFFYSTWKTQIYLGYILFERPFIYLINLFPLLKKNWNNGKKEYYKVMNSKEYGLNLGFAFSFMFLTTMVLYTSVCLILVKLLNVEVEDKMVYYFLAVIALSYLTNELLIYKSDTYKKYFEEFEKISNKSLIYLSAVLFHLAIIGFGILSVYYTVGFNI